MLEAMRGQKPDITPAQLVAVLVAGVPIISNLLHVFGVYDLSSGQEDALKEALTWGGVLAGALIFGDAGLRAARNRADAHVQSTALQAPGEPHDVLIGAGPVADADAEADSIPDGDLPSDAEEEAAPPPDDIGTLDAAGDGQPTVVQPSQVQLT